MKLYLKRPAHTPLWVAGLSVCMLATYAAIGGSIPASSADTPVTGAPSKQPVSARTADSATPLGVAQASGNRRNGSACPDCGVIESIRQIERAKDDGGHATTAKLGMGPASDRTVASAATSYQFTVRFRDGSTSIFSESNPRTWRLGSRVVVIGHSKLASN